MTAVEQASAAPVDFLQQARVEITAAWKDFEKRSISFGKLLFDWRERFSAQGNHAGDGFLPLLQEAGVPQRTAYYWINKYEVLIGLRQPKVETEPTEPIDEPETGGPSYIEEQPPLPPKVKPRVLQQAVTKLVEGMRIRLNGDGVIYKTKAEPELCQEKGGLFLRIPVEVA